MYKIYMHTHTHICTYVSLSLSLCTCVCCVYIEGSFKKLKKKLTKILDLSDISHLCMIFTSTEIKTELVFARGVNGGARGVMVIVVGNGHGNTSSNPGRH